MDHFADQLTDKNWRVVKQVAGQIAGRKPRRGHHDFRVEPHHKRRGGQTPWKDIADSDRNEIAEWIREDGHSIVEGGNLSDALRHTFHVMHHTYRRDANVAGAAGGGHVGGGFLDRIGSTLDNIGRAGKAQFDVMSDKFLSGMGITKSRYKNNISDEASIYARLNQDAYLKGTGRGSIAKSDGYEYLSDHSTDARAVYRKDGKLRVIFRGTRAGDAAAFKNNDLFKDASIAFGDTSEMMNIDDERTKVNQLFDEYGDGNVEFGAYSLGGGTALELMADDSIYKRLGEHNHMLAPGITALNPNLKKVSKLHKAFFTYHHNDAVANSLMAHSNDHHNVLTDQDDPLKAHLFLDRLAGANKSQDPEPK